MPHTFLRLLAVCFLTGIVEKSGHTLVQGSGQMVIYDQPFTHGKVSGNVVMEAPYNFLNNLYFSFMDVLDVERSEIVVAVKAVK